MNGEKEVTVKELTDAGYAVKFLYNQPTNTAIYNPTTGVVNGLTAVETFKYAVEITPAEGEKITSEWVDVTVVDVAAIEEVTAVELTNKLAYINVKESGVKLAATEAVNVGGKTVTEGLPAVKAITSSDETVLYANSDNTLTARKAGNVKLTVEFVGIKDKVTLDVEVKAQQEATSISDVTVKTSLTSKVAQFKVLDADSKELRAGSKTPTLSAVVKDSEGTAVETVSGSQAQFAAGVEIPSITKAGTYSVEVLDGTTKIGAYTLVVVDTANATADEYKILTADNKTTAVLDINAGADAANTTTINVTDYAKGVALGSTLDLTDSTKFEVVTATKDSKVVTVTPKADGTITLKAGTQTGTETITLKTVSGDYKESVATFEVTVKNTTPQVTTLTVKDSKDPIVLNESLLADIVANANDIKTAIASKVQSNSETFDAGLIDAFEVTSQGTVIVTIKAANGGKEFTLPFTLKDDVKPTITSATVGEVEGDLTTVPGEITFDIDEVAGVYTSGTVAVSEANVKAIITYENESYEVNATTALTDVLAAFKAAGGTGDDVTGSTLVANSGLLVELVDAAGNKTPYTINFK